MNAQEIIQKLRAAGWRIPQIAERCGVSPRTVNGWSQGVSAGKHGLAALNSIAPSEPPPGWLVQLDESNWLSGVPAWKRGIRGTGDISKARRFYSRHIAERAVKRALAAWPEARAINDIHTTYYAQKALALLAEMTLDEKRAMAAEISAGFMDQLRN